MSSSKEAVGGLIVLKCQGCKEPMLARLDICHEPDSDDLVAKTHCRVCESANPLRRLSVRTLEPAHVEKQRVQLGCFEPDSDVDTHTGREGHHG